MTSRATAALACAAAALFVGSVVFASALGAFDGNHHPGQSWTGYGFDIETSVSSEEVAAQVRRRVDQLGVSEPEIREVGSDQIVIDLPGGQPAVRCELVTASRGQAGGDGVIQCHRAP